MALKSAPTPCPVTRTARLLSDTWTMLIMHELLPAPKGFCELERGLKGISTRTLTLKLKHLEQEDLVKKAGDGRYFATPKGKGIRTIERAMQRYGEKFL